MSYPAISLTTPTVGRHRRPQKRLQTVANPPSTRIRARTIRVCYFLSPFQCPLPVHPCPSVDSGLVSVTFETDRQCRVEIGRWFGALTSVYVEDPSDLDIDHLVPLKNAHLSGAWRWDADMRQEYANYLEEEDHLIAVTAGANRSKGAKGPEEWGPPDLDYWCQYATDWTEVKARWGLTMTKVESEIVMDMLGTCENPPDMEVEELDYLGTLVAEHKPTPELQNSVYGSCEEAESAGEQRFQGSQGGGLGYPKAMVPSARDGDGDGVVCER